MKRGDMIVLLNTEKIRAMIKRKKINQNEVSIKVGMNKSYLSSSLSRGKCDKKLFYDMCKEMHVKPYDYILGEEPFNNRGKDAPKKPAKKAIVKTKDEVIIDPVVDKPLVIHLKDYNELSELIEVQKGIRDALRELVDELKNPKKLDARPKAYFKKEEKEVGTELSKAHIRDTCRPLPVNEVK